MTSSISDSSPADASPAPPATHAPASGGGGASITVSTMNDLKEKAPEVYNGMLQMLAQGMLNEQQDSQKRIHQANKETYGT